MKNTDSRETAIKVMRKVVEDVSPEVIIRRLQNDNAFVIYANMNGTDTQDRNNGLLKNGSVHGKLCS